MQLPLHSSVWQLLHNCLRHSQVQFIAGASVLRFSYAAGWPAEMKALKILVPEEHQPLAVSTLGFASRGGAILGMCFFGAGLPKSTFNASKCLVYVSYGL